MKRSFHHAWLWAAFLLLSACKQNLVTEDEPRQHIPDKLAEINTQLGVEYIKEGNNELALKKLEKAIDADPNYSEAYNVLGLLYARLGENDKADSAFKRAVGLDSRNPRILNNYGQFLCQRGQAGAAQELFAKAVQNPLYEAPEVAYTNAATCALEQQNDAVAAEKYLRAALEKNAQMPVALLQMAKLSYQQEKFLPARGYLQRYAEVAEHTAQSLWLGTQIERRLGDKDAEASYAMSLKGKFPDSEEAHQLLQTGK